MRVGALNDHQANLGLRLTGLTALSFSSLRSRVMCFRRFSTVCRCFCFSDNSAAEAIFFSFYRGLIEYSVSLHESEMSI